MLNEQLEYLLLMVSKADMMVLIDLDIQYCAVTKLILLDFVWKNILPLIKIRYIDNAPSR